jgi:hypothetical protein
VSKNQRAIVSARISSSARLSLGTIETGNGSGRLEAESALANSLYQSTVPYEKACICVIGRQVLRVTCLLNVENREQRRNNDKQRRVDEVSSGANAFSESECRC